MAEHDTPLAPELANPPLEDDGGLAPPPPIEDPVRGKKKLPLATKIGLSAVGGVMLVAGGVMIFGGSSATPHPVAPSSIGTAQTPGGSPPGTASDNPEIVALNKAATLDAATAAQKKGQSFVAPTTFDGSAEPATADTSSSQDLPPAPLATTPPPPAPTTADNQPDPVVTFYNQLLATRQTMATPGVFPGPAAVSPAKPLTTADATRPSPTLRGPKLANVGDIVYATLQSGLSSLMPQTPVRAVVHGGALNGAILVGSLSVTGGRYIVPAFQWMNFQGRSIQVKAIGVSADTQEAGLADAVKRHTLEKFAWSAGSGFLQGLGTAIAQQGNSYSQIVSPTGGEMVTQNSGQKTTRQLIGIGAGSALTAAQPLVNDQVNQLQTEIIVAPNKEIGIVFMAPVYLPAPDVAP